MVAENTKGFSFGGGVGLYGKAWWGRSPPTQVEVGPHPPQHPRKENSFGAEAAEGKIDLKVGLEIPEKREGLVGEGRTFPTHKDGGGEGWSTPDRVSGILI